jgi:hypothetical protein
VNVTDDTPVARNRATGIDFVAYRFNTVSSPLRGWEDSAVFTRRSRAELTVTTPLRG